LRKIGKEFDIVQYIGIAADEPIRLERIRGTNKVSLLEKYGYTEHDAMDKCKEYNLVSPLYSIGYRGGVGSVLMPTSNVLYTFARSILIIGGNLTTCITILSLPHSSIISRYMT
jgi:hypothetical protein